MGEHAERYRTLQKMSAISKSCVTLDGTSLHIWKTKDRELEQGDLCVCGDTVMDWDPAKLRGCPSDG